MSLHKKFKLFKRKVMHKTFSHISNYSIVNNNILPLQKNTTEHQTNKETKAKKDAF